jgi:hypothetical protein
MNAQIRAAAEELLRHFNGDVYEDTLAEAEAIIARHLAPWHQAAESMAESLTNAVQHEDRRAALATYRALAHPENLISELTDATDGRR